MITSNSNGERRVMMMERNRMGWRRRTETNGRQEVPPAQQPSTAAVCVSGKVLPAVLPPPSPRLPAATSGARRVLLLSGRKWPWHLCLKGPQRRDNAKLKRKEQEVWKDRGQASRGPATLLRTTCWQSGLNLSTRPKTPVLPTVPSFYEGVGGPASEPGSRGPAPRQLAHSTPGTLCSYRVKENDEQVFILINFRADINTPP